jgi:hypothetical protein
MKRFYQPRKAVEIFFLCWLVILAFTVVFARIKNQEVETVIFYPFATVLLSVVYLRHGVWAKKREIIAFAAVQGVLLCAFATLALLRFFEALHPETWKDLEILLRVFCVGAAFLSLHLGRGQKEQAPEEHP